MNKNKKKPSEKQVKIYAKVVNQNDFTHMSVTDMEFFERNYIFRCVEGPFAGLQCKLQKIGDVITIGSDTSQNFLYINDKNVSKRHCSLTNIDSTFYYYLIDNNSETGTWLFLSNLEDGYEITETMTFKLFNHVMKFNVNFQNQNHNLEVTEGPKKGSIILLKKEIKIGKRQCDLELEMDCEENLEYLISKKEGKIIISNITKEITNQGMYVRLKPNQKIKVGPGDLIKIGLSSFKIMTYNLGVFSDIGNRDNQEDKYCIIDDLRFVNGVVIPFYAVYDGHGGPTCSYYLKQNFHHILQKNLRKKNLHKSKNFINDLIQAIQEIIIMTDFQYNESENHFSLIHGSTCVFLFFIGTKILCCNLGDSVSILSKKNEQIIFLSKDLKPSRELEKKRIAFRNGFITEDGRLLGTINVSRAFGDWKFKNKEYYSMLKKINENDEYGDYLISNRAEFRIIELDPEEDQYVILASDGVFQNLSYEKVFGIINDTIRFEHQNSKILRIPRVAKEIANAIKKIYNNNDEIKEKGDNRTLILIDLDLGKMAFNNKNFI